ncbi:ORF MSV258 hypothetical protein [Melanoplus sanguinipes entomopoxvirus]|uniref:Uncharacterized protein n=1 Tax=Melanoplus sanguinipes entomopoxvirus TaxID=83191 RepID=Q9YVI4_MSEPV|nr:ORF MSV258 hypothetical protein [Melanoplus sanguinipes entomopoxvirus]AAC97738.1 ORF MSV258 hypothetical protein [Melanoplus sanguinipes entomopoxvirus 'O']
MFNIFRLVNIFKTLILLSSQLILLDISNTCKLVNLLKKSKNLILHELQFKLIKFGNLKSSISSDK